MNEMLQWGKDNLHVGYVMWNNVHSAADLVERKRAAMCRIRSEAEIEIARIRLEHGNTLEALAMAAGVVGRATAEIRAVRETPARELAGELVSIRRAPDQI